LLCAETVTVGAYARHQGKVQKILIRMSKNYVQNPSGKYYAHRQTMEDANWVLFVEIAMVYQRFINNKMLPWRGLTNEGKDETIRLFVKELKVRFSRSQRNFKIVFFYLFDGG
jgi:hypothetical protein